MLRRPVSTRPVILTHRTGPWMLLGNMDRPEMKYATNAAGLNISYLTFGDARPHILWVPNFTGRVEALWHHPVLARFMRRLASIGRLTAFDTSGTGGSDPIPPDELPTIEHWMDDVRAVLDAEGIERATLFAMDSGGPLASVFAATHPERVDGLIFIGSYARLAAAPDHPWGFPQEAREPAIDRWMEVWGTGAQLRLTAPSLAGDEGFREWLAFMERLSAPKRMWRPIFEMISDLDVRHVLPAIRVPTLVLHRVDDRWIPPEHGQYLADNIPGARYVGIPGDDHYPFAGDTDPLLSEVREFVTGARDAPSEEERSLATLLFTDIVDSTVRAAELGDRPWRDLLDRHDDGVRHLLTRFRGREIKTTGDGFFASFDGPARAVRCASAIADLGRELGIPVRAGLHCGEVEIRGDDIVGLSVHLASRVAGLAQAGQILVSQTVKDLTIGSGLGYADHGSHELKGVPGEWRLYSVTNQAAGTG